MFWVMLSVVDGGDGVWDFGVWEVRVIVRGDAAGRGWVGMVGFVAWTSTRGCSGCCCVRLMGWAGGGGFVAREGARGCAG